LFLFQARSKAEITGGAKQIDLVNPPPPVKIQTLTNTVGHKAYKNSCQTDTSTVHNATVCVDFVKKDSFIGISFVENLLKSSFPFAFSPTKLLGNIHQIYSISFQKESLKLKDLNNIC